MLSINYENGDVVYDSLNERYVKFVCNWEDDCAFVSYISPKKTIIYSIFKQYIKPVYEE